LKRWINNLIHLVSFMLKSIRLFLEFFTGMSTMKPADVKGYRDLLTLAQALCNQHNHIDGIIILCPNNYDNLLFLNTYTESKIEGIDIEAFAGSLLGTLNSAEDMILSASGFETGNIKTIIYEYDSLRFVIYSVRGESLQNVYLVLINSDNKDLGAFNANRSQVRSQMEVAIKRCGLLS